MNARLLDLTTEAKARGTWTHEGDFGASLINRQFAQGMDRLMGRTEAGLKNLKATAERT